MNMKAISTSATKRQVDHSANVVKVMLVDDHPIVRHGLAQLVNDAPHLSVCGETDNVSDAISMIRNEPPDLVILDLSLRSGSGLEIIKHIRSSYGDRIRVLVTSMHDESIYADRAIQAGANGYLQKDEATTRLLEAIDRVLGGKTFLSAGMTERLLKRAIHGKADQHDTSPVDSLSDRELEVFEMIGKGLSTRNIAEKLHLSPKTIETYRQHIKRKLTLTNSSELAVHAAAWVLEQTNGVMEDKHAN